MALWAQKPPLAAYPEEIKTIGDHLKKKRMDLKTLQKEVADKLNVTICTYRNWEENRPNPSLPFIPKIIEFLCYVPCDMSCNNLVEKIIAYRKIFGLS